MWIICKGVQDPIKKQITSEYTCILIQITKYLYTAHIAGFLLEAGSRVPAPVYFNQSARLLKVRN